MANHLRFVISAQCIVFVFSYAFSASVDPSSRTFSNIVLDGKHDCGIIDDQKAIAFFPSHTCGQYLPKFVEDYFGQRYHLACFGIYESLLSLCDFDIKDVSLTVPSEFKDSATFCVKASTIYNNLNYSYTGDEVKKWSEALRNVMTNKTSCDNLCIFNKVDEHCAIMLSAANEYLRLKGINREQTQVTKKSNETVPLNDQTSPTPANVILVARTQAGTENSSTSPPVPQEIIQTDRSDQSDSHKSIPNADGLGKSNNPLPQNAALPSLTNAPVIVSNASENKSAVVAAGRKEIDKAQPDAVVPVENGADEGAPEPVANVAAEGAAEPIGNKPSIALSEEQPDLDGTMPEPEDEAPGTDGTEGGAKTVADDDKPVSTNQEEKPDDEKPVSTNQEEKPGMVNDPENVRALANDPMLKDNFVGTEDSYAFSYFATIATLCFLAYFLFHHKNKLFALALEGRKGRSMRGRGRPSSANYTKLHSNLEEAIASNVSTPSATHVLY